MVSDKNQALIDAARLRIVSRANPRLETLPDWMVEYRSQQVEAVKAVVDGFADNDVVVLDAPTGSGKTLIAETVRRLLGVRGLYVCNSIHLQHQFSRDFPYSSVLKGRSNYKPVRFFGDITCADCSKPECALCPTVGECPYEIAKRAALKNELTVVNTSYLLTEGNGPGSIKGRALVVLDEADTLESEVMRYVGVRIGARNVRGFGLGEPEKVTVRSSWDEWFGSTIGRLTQLHNGIRGNDYQQQRRKDYLARLLVKLRWIRPQLEDGWVYTGKGGAVEFKPVRVDDACRKLLWPLGKKWLLMSASIISAGALLEDLGWNGAYKAVNLGSTFPVENRQVRITTCANVTKKGGDDERRKLGEGIARICDEHPNERILVHAVSYDLSRYIVRVLGSGGQRPVLSYETSDGKGTLLANARRLPGSIIVAPSFDRGVDLPDDLCRVVIVAKVPYPYLGDRQVNARLYGKGGRTWYSVQTVRSIVQMTGRGVRHENDWCTGYILDAQFRDLWNNARGLFPRWWVEGLVW
jgi:Rad3-related DNA helicase